MISKPIPARSFYHTCRYICQKQGAEVLITEGVRGHDYKLMAEDFEMQKQLRPSKEMACFHGILSFYPGEKPSDETMTEIAKKYLERLGIENTQYAISKHTDKAHLHLHIVANMVNNEGKAISDSWIGYRGKKIAQQLTLEYKLVQALNKNLSLTHVKALSQSEANKYKIYMAISENLAHCRTMDELEKRLAKQGIETQYKYKGQTLEKQGVSFKIENDCFKGSKIDRRFSLGNLEKTMELQQKQVLQQKQEISKSIQSRKLIHQQNDSQDQSLEKYRAEDLARGMEKAIDILLRTKHNEQSPSELLEEEKRRRKRLSQDRGLSR